MGVIALIFSVISKVAAQQANPSDQPMTLAQIWQKAEAANKTLQMQELQVKMSEQQLKDARAERLPEVSASTEYARIGNFKVYENGVFHAPQKPEIIPNSFALETEAYLNVYNGNKVKTRIAAEEVAHHLTEERKNEATSVIKLRATAAYLDLQRNLIFKDLLTQTIHESEKQLAEIRELHKNGVVLRSDVLRAELQLSQQQMTLVEIENNIALANQKLALMIGLADTVRINPVEDNKTLALPETYEEYLVQAMGSSHQIKISERETELSQLRIKEVRADRLPKVGLFAGLGYHYPQIALFLPYSDALYSMAQAGVKISYSISSLYHNRHKEEAAVIAWQQQEIAHADTQDALREAVKEGYVRYAEALQRIRVAELNIRQAEESYRIVRNTYFNQLSLLTDLLNADNQLLQSRFDLATAQIKARLQYYQLLNTIGKL